MDTTYSQIDRDNSCDTFAVSVICLMINIFLQLMIFMTDDCDHDQSLEIEIRHVD